MRHSFDSSDRLHLLPIDHERQVFLQSQAFSSLLLFFISFSQHLIVSDIMDLVWFYQEASVVAESVGVLEPASGQDGQCLLNE